MRYMALMVGVLVTLQGLLGLAVPELFVEIVRFFQTAPTIYLAAVVRVAFGLVLLAAASQARSALLLRVLGIAIAVGGVLTPFVGIQFSAIILSWWAEGGAAVVRIWAFGSLLIGAFILYATSPGRRAS